jgi:hypothetical protein
MLIFYAWVVFLVAIILSVPIVYFVEISRYKKTRAAANLESDQEVQGEDEPVLDDISDEAPDEVPDEMAGFEAEMPSGEDDFSAFEEEFK